MKTLFLITKTYPYGPYEQYVTSELWAIHAFFEKIVIYPNDYYGPDKAHNLGLPPNVEVLNLNLTLPKKSSNRLADYLYLLRTTLIEFFATDDRKNFFRLFRWNLSHFWTQYQLARHFTRYLQNNNYSSANSVFYSYWFHKGAIFLSILKDKKIIRGFVCRAHSIELYHNDWKIANEKHRVPSFKMFKLKHTSHILTVSRHGYDYLTHKYPQYKEKIKVAYLGVQAPASDHPIENSGNFHIVTCSTVDENKRVHKLAEALTHIKQPVRWTHFGTGSKEYMELINKYTNAAPDNIDVRLAGSVPNQEVQKFYASHKADLFVNLSIVEGLPIAIMEALSHGIPVLATAVYGTPEAVIDGQTGFLLDVNFSVDELVGKLHQVMENKDQLQRMSENCRSLYAQKFDAKKNHESFAREFLLN